MLFVWLRQSIFTQKKKTKKKKGGTTSVVQVLVAWGPQAVVISFRGTSSVKGAKMDICVRAPTLALHPV